MNLIVPSDQCKSQGVVSEKNKQKEWLATGTTTEAVCNNSGLWSNTLINDRARVGQTWAVNFLTVYVYY